MKTKLNITAMPVRVGLNGMNEPLVIETEDGSQIGAMEQLYGDKDAHKEAEENTLLCVQAFNVANRTGLMPEELEKQRNELVGILEDVINSAKPHPIENPTMFETWQSIKRILAEIKS